MLTQEEIDEIVRELKEEYGDEYTEFIEQHKEKEGGGVIVSH